MRTIAIIAAVLALSAAPAMGQEAPDPARSQQLELADRYLALAQGPAVSKVVRQQLEEFYADGSIPTDQQAWLAEAMTEAYEEVIVLVSAEMREDVADRFSRSELEALIAFYDTPAGRAIVLKEAEMSLALQDAMMPHMMTRMAAMGEKFCQRFDCTEMGDALAKQGD